MHPTGFEPVTFLRKTDYESGAFNHSATDAHIKLFSPIQKRNYFILECLYNLSIIILSIHNYKPKSN